MSVTYSGSLRVSNIIDLILRRRFQDVVHHCWKVLQGHFIMAAGRRVMTSEAMTSEAMTSDSVPEAPEVIPIRCERLVFEGPGVPAAVSQPHVVAAVG